MLNNQVINLGLNVKIVYMYLIKMKPILLSDRQIERQCLIKLKSIYEEYLLNINERIKEIDKNE